MKSSFFMKLFGVLAFVGLFFAADHYKSEVVSQMSDVGGQMSDVGGQMLDVSRESLVVSRKLEVGKDSLVIKKNISLQAKAKTADERRACIASWMKSQVGVREKTGKNDGKKVDGYFASINWKNSKQLKASEKPWCGAFMGNAWLQCMPDSSIGFVDNKKELAQVRAWERGKKVSRYEAAKGDATTLRAFSHVEGIYDVHPNPTFRFVTIIGGNTGAAANDPDQRDGVFLKTRLWSQIKSVISVERNFVV